MIKNSNYKKLNKHYIFLLIVSIVVFVISTISITISYFYDSDEDFFNTTIGNIKVNVESDLAFDATILPNTNYAEMNTIISSSGNSGDIFIKVVIDNSHVDNIYPVIENESKWVKQDNEYYYLDTLAKNESVTFISGFSTYNNFTNAIAGDLVEITVTVYGIQSQYDAYLSSPAWINPPQEFLDFAKAY